MERNTITVAGICGTLRQGSYNRFLLVNAIKIAKQEGIIIKIAEIDQLPLYNQDLDLIDVSKRPLGVKKLRKQIKKADGILIVSPAYNYTVPGPLKNALDWASRGNHSFLEKKPVALISACTSSMQTTRMQLHFNSLFLSFDMQPVYYPEVVINNADEKFSSDGELVDETAKQLLRKKLARLQQVIFHQRR